MAEREIIISLDKVRDELYSNNDDLTIWCKANLPQHFFKDSSTSIIDYATVTGWAIARRFYTQQALNEFLDAKEADAWIIGYAKTNRFKIVTHEVSTPNSQKKVKMPDVCSHFGISHLNTIELFREIGESF